MRGEPAPRGTPAPSEHRPHSDLEDHRFHHYSGAVLGYRFRRPGRYRIRLDVTDTFGVKGRASRVIVVTGSDYGPHNLRRPVVLSRR